VRKEEKEKKKKKKRRKNIDELKQHLVEVRSLAANYWRGN